MQTPQFILDLDDELIVDEFACGGGMSEAIEQAIGRHVDIAVNHDEDACSMHAINHPQTQHYWKDVYEVQPRKVTGNRAVGLLHLSPDCTHHSQARGGQPRSKKLRGLCWIAVRWAGQKRPRIISLENVKQFLQYGPLIAKRCPKTGRVMKIDGTVAAIGERTPVEDQYLVPDRKRIGESWRKFKRTLEKLGYEVQTRILCAADYGAPTTRSRLFMVARCDGAPIIWPEPTHFKKPAKGQKRWKSAAECIDWTIPSRSVFNRTRWSKKHQEWLPDDLAEATLRRVAHGLKRFVLDSADPFIVQIANWSREGLTNVQDPLSTVTAYPRGGSHALVTPVMIQAGHGDGKPGARRWIHGNTSPRNPVGTFTASGGGQAMAVGTLVQMGYGEREGQSPRALDVTKPLGTAVGGGNKFAAVTAFVEQANGGFNEIPGRDARDPLSTSTGSGSQQRLVTAHLATLRHNCIGADLKAPVPTMTAGGEHHALVEYALSPEAEEGAERVAAFLIRYYGQGGQLGDLKEPMSTSTTKDRLALVTVWLRGEPYVVVDIQLRMLVPRELYNANSFPRTYIIDRGHDGRKFSKSTQVRMCGNAVPPLLGKAVIQANWNSRPALKEAA